MNEPKRRSPKSLRFLPLSLMAVATTGFIIFKLFEPVFVWNNGWEALPELDRTVSEQTPVAPEYTDLINTVNDRLDQAVNRLNLPALSVAVGQGGELVWARATGYQNLESKLPVKLETPFRIGSVSKAVTAVAAATLVQEGVLNLDAQLSELVPYFPKKQFELTPRQLLTHTGGIRHYGACLCFPFDEYSNRKNHKTVESAVMRFADSPLLFEPGTAFSYSSFGFTLASAAMEGASGLSFDNIIKDKISEPLNMPNTMREGLAGRDIAVPYDVRSDTFKRAFRVDNSNKTAGGGFVSTPTDLVAMTQAVLSGQHIGSWLGQELFFTPQTLSDGSANEQNYALGWRSHLSEGVFGKERKVMVSHHGGVAMGGTAFLIMYPEHGISIALVTNRQMEGVGELVTLAQSIAKDLILASESN